MSVNLPFLAIPGRIFLCILLLLSFSACSKEKDAPAPTSSGAKDIAAETTVLATVSVGQTTSEAGRAGPRQSSTGLNLFKILFNEQGRSVAYIVEVSGAVHVGLNGARGKPYQGIGTLELSPDGQHIAYSAFDKNGWRMVHDGEEGMIVDEIGTPVFSPDSRHFAYDAKVGEEWVLVVDGKTKGTGQPQYSFHDKFFSTDSTRLVSIEFPDDIARPVRISVSELTFRSRRVKELPASDFVLNKDKTKIALVGSYNGKKRIVEFAFDRPAAAVEGPLYDDIIHPEYAADGVSLAYVAKEGGTRYLVFDGKEEQIPKSEQVWSLVVRPDKRGVGVILASEKGTFLHQAFYNEGVKEKKYLDAGGLIYNSDSSRHAYIAARGKKIFMVVNGKEGPAFDMIVTPLFSPDGRFLVYRARKDGKRFVVIADASGRTLRQLPAYEQVYQPIFAADGKSIGYGVKDGWNLVWNVVRLAEESSRSGN